MDAVHFPNSIPDVSRLKYLPMVEGGGKSTHNSRRVGGKIYLVHIYIFKNCQPPKPNTIHIYKTCCPKTK